MMVFHWCSLNSDREMTSFFRLILDKARTLLNINFLRNMNIVATVAFLL